MLQEFFTAVYKYIDYAIVGGTAINVMERANETTMQGLIDPTTNELTLQGDSDDLSAMVTY